MTTYSSIQDIVLIKFNLLVVYVMDLFINKYLFLLLHKQKPPIIKTFNKDTYYDLKLNDILII